MPRGRALPSRLPLAVALAVLGLAAPGADASRLVLSSPGRILVELTRGDALAVPVAVAVPALGAEPLDFFLIEDASSNFASGLLSFQGEVGALGPRLQADHPGAQLGLGSFVDKPLSPFGNASFDYVYETNLPLSPTPAELSAAAAALTTRWGRDLADSQLEALMQVGLRAFDEVGFRPAARRLAVLSTDTVPHLDVDGLRVGLPPNNGDEILDGTPPGAGESYPSIDEVRAALLSHGVLPIFAVLGTSLPTYQSLVTQLGFGSAVALGKNGTNVRGAIEAGLGAMLYGIEPSVEGDVHGYVAAVNPSAQLGVAAGETRTFQLTLLWGQSGDELPPAGEKLWVRTPYGDTRIDVELDSGLPACSDGIDNDGDGRVDYGSDLGCSSPDDPSEEPECSDGIDNDGDGRIDSDDPTCAGSDKVMVWSEYAGCSDGIDNDGDGLADYPNDPKCMTPYQYYEDRPYCGLLGIEWLLAPGIAALLRRRRR